MQEIHLAMLYVKIIFISSSCTFTGALINPMMDVLKEEYKGLILSTFPKLRTLEVLVDKFNFHDRESTIISLSILVEYIAYHPHRFVIFNKLNTDYEADTSLHAFIKNLIYSQLKAAGVRKVIFLVNQELYDKIYQKFSHGKDFMMGFIQRTDALEWLEGQSDYSPPGL